MAGAWWCGPGRTAGGWCNYGPYTDRQRTVPHKDHQATKDHKGARNDDIRCSATADSCGNGTHRPKHHRLCDYRPPYPRTRFQGNHLRTRVCLELDACGIRYECEKKILVPYRTWQIPGHTIDLIVEGCVIAELKSVSRLKKVHERQVVSYLKATQLRLGFLINFNVPIVKQGIRRIVL